ncbi:MAG: helix-turn-helix domain-containing protein [Alkalibacterium sp.]|nr:helix-turn-helix domain-containing protein [Alkalibacterium sp.]
MYDSIGRKLKTARKSKGLTLTEVAREVNCSPAYICRIEGESRHNINYKLYSELMKLYGIEDDMAIGFNLGGGIDQDSAEMMEDLIKQNEKMTEIQWTILKINEDLSVLKNLNKEIVKQYLQPKTE